MTKRLTRKSLLAALVGLAKSAASKKKARRDCRIYTSALADVSNEFKLSMVDADDADKEL